MWSPLDILSLESYVLLATALLLIRYYIHRRWQVLKDLGIPHDPPSILDMGNLKSTFAVPEEHHVPIRHKRDYDEQKAVVVFFKNDLENKKKFGKVFGIYSALEPRITIWDPTVLKHIQIKEFSHFPDRQAGFLKVNGEMNDGLVASTGEQWKRMRNALTPTFSSSKLKQMLSIVVQCADHMVENLKKTATENDGKFNTKEVLGKLSLDVICSAAFGVNVHSQEEGKEQKVVEMAKKLFNVSLLSNPFIMLFLIFPWTENIASFFNYSVFPRSITNYFCSLVNLMIKKKQSLGEKARVDILKCMLEAEVDKKDLKPDTKGICREEIVANSMLMLMAGYDTTSSAMQFLVYNLAVHKECQEKLREEIKDTVKKHGGLTYEALGSMKYLMMCFNESMRIYPPAVRNSRLCKEDITIGGMKILKGMHIDIPIYGMTRDPEIWDDPLVFKPERMEDTNKVDPIIFQPFGVGPRNCIGMRFAMMEVKVAICKLLMNFRLDVADDTPKPPLDIIFRTAARPKVDVLSLRVTLLDEEVA